MKNTLIILFISYSFSAFSQPQTAKSAVKELPAYDYVANFYNGCAYVQKIVKKDSVLFGFIDKTGKEIVPCTQKAIHSYRDFSYSDRTIFFGNPFYYFVNKGGLTVVKENEQELVYDIQKKKSLGNGYQHILMYPNNFIAYKNDSTLCLLNDSGKVLFEATTKDIIQIINRNRYIYLDTSNKWHIVDSSKKLIRQIPHVAYGRMNPLSETRLEFEHYYDSDFFDQDGQVVESPKYDKFSRIQEGYGTARKSARVSGDENKIYLIDANGQPVVIKNESIKILDGVFFNEGSIPVLVKLGNDKTSGYAYSLMDNQGNLVLKPVFEKIYNFSEGIAPFEFNNSQFYGCVDKTGKLLFRTSNLAFFKDGLAVVRNERFMNGDSTKYEIIDKQGKILMQTKPVKKE
jgi:hypothetical protein